MSPQVNGARDKFVRFLLWCGIITIAVTLLPRLPRELPLNDFIEYWSASRLFVTGINPYSPAAILSIERSLGWTQPQALPMLNPPWFLPVIAPLAAMPFRTSQIFWFIVSATSLFASANILWRHYGGRPDQRPIAWACAAMFFPNPVALRMAQVAPIILVGLVAFLICIRKGRLWLAGASLFALGIKPHLLIPLGIVVVIWTIQERRWPILGGLLLALGIATIAAWLINPAALTGYINVWRNSPPGDLMRLRFGFENTWLQLLPAVVGIVWGFMRWHRYRTRWNWGEQLPALVLGSFITAPYGWTFDQPVLMTAVVCGGVSLAKNPSVPIIAAFVAGNLLVALLVIAQFRDASLLLSAPLWALLYAAAVRRGRETP